MSDQRNDIALKQAKEANQLLVYCLVAFFLGLPLAAAMMLAGNFLLGLLASAVSLFFLTSLPILWAAKVLNIFNALVSQLNGIIGDLNSSIQRKSDLQQLVRSLATTISEGEAKVHIGVVSELRRAAEEIAVSPKPMLLLANLASNFPNLQNSSGFIEAQRIAKEIEQSVDRDVRSVNAKGAAFNEIRSSLPIALLATFVFREFKAITSTSVVEEFNPWNVRSDL